MSRIIDPDGDIVLIVGKNNVTDLRVSSKALSLASPVFGALFKPHFKEGAEMRASSYHTSSTNTEPFHLLLPEDDPDAMHLLCNTLHYRQTATPPLKQLKQLAILCDKYQCAPALSVYSTMWLEGHLTSLSVAKIIECDTLAIAYLFGSESAFLKITKTLLRNHTGSFNVLKQGDLGGCLPVGILVQLEDRRRAALLSFTKAIGQPITTLLGKVGEIWSCKSPDYRNYLRDTEFSDHHAQNFCLYDSLRLSGYMRELHRLGLYPFPPKANLSLLAIMNKVANYSSANVKSMTFGLGSGIGTCLPGCACQMVFEQELYKAHSFASTTLEGLPLSRFRNMGAVTAQIDGSGAKRKRESDDCSASSTRAQSGL